MTPEQQKAMAVAAARLRLKQKQAPQQTPVAEPPKMDIRAPATLTPGGMAPFSRAGGKAFLEGIADIGEEAGRFAANLPVPSFLEAEKQKSLTAFEQQASERAARNAAEIPQEASAYRTMGQVAGGMAIPVPGGAGAGLIKNTLSGIAGGVIGGALTPTTDKTQPYWEQKREQMALGGIIGGGIGGGFGALGALASPNISDDVKLLIKEGVNPTPGQIMGGIGNRIEEKAASIPILGDVINTGRERAVQQLNRAAYNRVLEPLGEKYTGEIGREGIDKIHDMITAKYDQVVPKLSMQVDEQLFNELAALETAASKLTDQPSSYFSKTVPDLLNTVQENGVISGEAFKALESKLGREAASFKKSGDAFQQRLGDIFRDMQTAFRDALARQNPAAAELKPINDAFRRLVTLERAAVGAGQDALISPAGLSQAVKMTDASGRRSQFARGEAMMQDLSEAGRNVLGSRVPNSGSADRMLAAGGALGLIDPTTLATLGTASLPYLTPAGQRLSALAMTARPASAPMVRRGIEASVPRVVVPLSMLGQERRQ